MKSLHIGTVLETGKAFTLPRDFVTNTAIIYGGRGMGKTNLGGVLIEELYAAGCRFSVIDPMGVWWGIQHSEDGKTPGLEVLILGGTHGDMPIDPHAGAVVADLVVDEHVNVVIDIKRKRDGTVWTLGERVRFITDYITRFHNRQGERKRPIMQIIDEAARFVPQMIPKGSVDLPLCMGAIERMVEEGRNDGIGTTLITQRSARMNKSVSELADLMFAFRTVGPNSIDAVLDWMGEHIPKDEWKKWVEHLRKLPRGDAITISPGWLKFEGIVRIRKRNTFDSSATPTGGERKPKGKAAKPDLEKYQQRMAETIEQAKANDPKLLKAEISRLKSDLAKVKPAQAQTIVKSDDKAIARAVREATTENARAIDRLQKAIEAAMKFIVKINAEDLLKLSGDAVDPAQIEKAIKAAVDQAMKLVEQKIEQRNRDVRALKAEADRLLKALEAVKGDRAVHVEVNVKHNKPFTVEQSSAVPSKARKPVETKGDLTKPMQKIIDAVAWWKAVDIDQPSHEQVAFVAGYSPNGSGFKDPRSRLVTSGYLTYPKQGYCELTDAGASLANQPESVPTWKDFLERVTAILTGPQWKIFKAVVDAGKSISHQDLADATGYSADGSGFKDPRSALRTLGLIDYPSQGMNDLSDHVKAMRDK